MKKKIIFDCDPGSDDAIAIMLAMFSEELDVLGITVVNGNRILPKTLENALRVVQFIDSKVPVYRGCEHAIVSKLIPERKPKLPRVTLNDCHGDYMPLPEAKIKEEKEHAVNFITKTLLESDGDITLVCVGPLTNIAMALRMEPKIEEKIKEIVIMGGAIAAGNASESAEFNFFADPEAAKIVMDTTVKKVILPLDATWRACVTLDQCDELDTIGNPYTDFMAKMVRLRIEGLKVVDISDHNYELRHKKGTVGESILYRYDNTMAPVHDALAIAYVIDPTVVTEYFDAHVDIDIGAGLSDGRLVADYHNTRKDNKNIVAKVALNADADKFYNMLKERLIAHQLTK